MSAAATTIGDYLDAVGARTPSPASGCAAAISAALGAAAAELAARFSGEDDLAERLHELRLRLAELADEDAAAFTAYMATRSSGDRDRIVQVPLAIAETAAEARDLAEALLGRAGRSVRGDAEAGAALAAAAARVAARLVEINLEPTPGDPRLARARATAQRT